MIGTARSFGTGVALLVVLLLVAGGPAAAGIVDEEEHCVGEACAVVHDQREDEQGPGEACDHQERTGLMVFNEDVAFHVRAAGRCQTGLFGERIETEQVGVVLTTPLTTTKVSWVGVKFGSYYEGCTTTITHSGPVTGFVAASPNSASGGHLDDCPAGHPPDLSGDHI